MQCPLSPMMASSHALAHYVCEYTSMSRTEGLLWYCCQRECWSEGECKDSCNVRTVLRHGHYRAKHCAGDNQAR
jgi:hypothetical protein